MEMHARCTGRPAAAQAAEFARSTLRGPRRSCSSSFAADPPPGPLMLTASSNDGIHDPDAELLELLELIFDGPDKNGLGAGVPKRRHLCGGVFPGADQQMLADDLFTSIEKCRHQSRDAVGLAATFAEVEEHRRDGIGKRHCSAPACDEELVEAMPAVRKLLRGGVVGRREPTVRKLSHSLQADVRSPAADPDRNWGLGLRLQVDVDR